MLNRRALFALMARVTVLLLPVAQLTRSGTAIPKCVDALSSASTETWLCLGRTALLMAKQEEL